MIDIRRESLGSRGRTKGNGRKGGCRAISPEGEIYVGPTFAAICRYKDIDFSGKSASNALRALGWTLEEVEGEVYEEVKRIK